MYASEALLEDFQASIERPPTGADRRDRLEIAVALLAISSRPLFNVWLPDLVIDRIARESAHVFFQLCVGICLEAERSGLVDDVVQEALSLERSPVTIFRDSARVKLPRKVTDRLGSPRQQLLEDVR